MPTPVVHIFRSRGIAATPGYSVFIVPWVGHKTLGSNTVVARNQSSTSLGGGELSIGDSGGSNAALNHISWDVWVENGTYKLALVSTKGTNRGIATFDFDGSNFTTLDLYAAAGTENNYSEATGLTFTKGLKNLRLSHPTKNASASSYNITIASLALIRTGA